MKSRTPICKSEGPGPQGFEGYWGAGPTRMNQLVVRETPPDSVSTSSERFQAPWSAVWSLVSTDGGSGLHDATCVLSALGFRVHLATDAINPYRGLRCSIFRGSSRHHDHGEYNPPEYNGYKVYWGNGARIILPRPRYCLSYRRGGQP